jgi:chromosome segregation ATPase
MLIYRSKPTERELEKQRQDRFKRDMERYDKEMIERKKYMVLEEIKQLKSDNGDLSKVYSKKEIADIKKAELKEVKDSLDKKLKHEIKNEKQHFNEQIQSLKEKHSKTMKRLSRINKEEKSLMMDKLENRWYKQFGKAVTKKRCPIGTRKNKVEDCVKK